MEKVTYNIFNWFDLNINSRPDFGVQVLLGKKSTNVDNIIIDLGYLESIDKNGLNFIIKENNNFNQIFAANKYSKIQYDKFCYIDIENLK